jgi:hypothetical protein
LEHRDEAVDFGDRTRRALGHTAIVLSRSGFFQPH